ncbi:hypothetical protein [Hahella ganghwensis]|uniref:hypothetical protein n=1 Tax=Hahella ganghwensis TaxID=286420 RepID=UPI00037A7C74|nr:hypothetical protein [Hahella ganghwensis]
MEYTLFLNICMIGRLVYLFSDGPLTRYQWMTMIGVQLLGLLCFNWHLMQLYCAVLLGVILIAELHLQPAQSERHGLRLFSFLFLMAVSSLAFAEGGLTLAPWVVRTGEWVQTNSALIPSLQPNVWQLLNVILLGMLLTANEVNLIIRLVFHLFQLEPRRAVEDKTTDQLMMASERDDQEYNAGRIIGILERWIILVVILVANQLSVVAFIMAAKSFARFKQLEEKVFAEYVLVGTLLSTFLTLVVAMALGKFYFTFSL